MNLDTNTARPDVTAALSRLLSDSALWRAAPGTARRHVELAIGAVRNNEGRVTHWVLSFSDRSEAERLRAELESLRPAAAA